MKASYRPNKDVRNQNFISPKVRHARYLDSVAYQSLCEFEQDEYDLIALEVPLEESIEVPDTDIRMPGHRMYGTEEVTDIDMLLVDLDGRRIAAYEVKPNESRETYRSGRKQLMEFKDCFKTVKEELEEDFPDIQEWSLGGQVLHEFHLNEPYTSNVPNVKIGNYSREESVEKMLDRPEFLEMDARLLEMNKRGYQLDWEANLEEDRFNV